MTKISDLTELVAPEKADDFLVVIDTSDLTMSPEGTNKKISIGTIVDGLLNDRGNYDASSSVFPSSGGSGPSGAIRRGDIWRVSVAGNIGDNGFYLAVGDTLRALVDAPGGNPGNWLLSNSDPKIVNYSQLTTTDPEIAGRLWVNPANQFALTVSQGP